MKAYYSVGNRSVILEATSEEIEKLFKETYGVDVKYDKIYDFSLMSVATFNYYNEFIDHIYYNIFVPSWGLSEDQADAVRGFIDDDAMLYELDMSGEYGMFYVADRNEYLLINWELTRYDLQAED